MTTCRDVSSWIDTYVDGELPVERAVDTECHVAQCPSCAERLRFERAYRNSVKRVVQDQSHPSLAFTQRMERALIAESALNRVYACTPTASVNHASGPSAQGQARRQPVEVTAKHRGAKRQNATTIAANTWGTLRWRTLLPIAAAAAGAIFWAGFQNQRQIPMALGSTNNSDLRLSELDSYLDVMVNRHRGSSSQTRSIQFSHEDMLDPPFQLPLFQDVRNLDGSPFAIRMHATSGWLSALRGASSAYQIKGHRVTFFAYEAGPAPLRARLEGHPLRGHVVYVGKRQGYSVATVEEGPVGYAMTSDLPPLESAELIASAIDARVRH